MNVLLGKIEALEKELSWLKQQVEDEWPKMGDEYFAVTPTYCCSDDGVEIDESYVEQITWKGYVTDDFYRLTGNCFRTEEEARFHLERLKVMAELEQLSDNDGKEFTGVWTIDEDGESIFPICNVNSVGTPYVFSSKCNAYEAIKKIGEERLRKYWFGVKEVYDE